MNMPNILGNTPLHTAAVSNHVGCTRELIKRGAKVTATNKRGSTALLFAVYGLQSASSESTQITSLLMQVRPNQIRSTPGSTVPTGARVRGPQTRWIPPTAVHPPWLRLVWLSRSQGPRSSVTRSR